jgi:hypothetical protein
VPTLDVLPFVEVLDAADERGCFGGWGDAVRVVQDGGRPELAFGSVAACSYSMARAVDRAEGKDRVANAAC